MLGIRYLSSLTVTKKCIYFHGDTVIVIKSAQYSVFEQLDGDRKGQLCPRYTVYSNLMNGIKAHNYMGFCKY